MQFCSVHWEELSDAIKTRGLWHLVPTSGEEAVRRVGEDEFDPLMGAHNVIIGHALEAGGVEVMSDNNDGTPRCPVCYGISHDPEVASWITHAVEGCLKYAVDRGLVQGGTA